MNIHDQIDAFEERLRTYLDLKEMFAFIKSNIDLIAQDQWIDINFQKDHRQIWREAVTMDTFYVRRVENETRIYMGLDDASELQYKATRLFVAHLRKYGIRHKAVAGKSLRLKFDEDKFPSIKTYQELVS